MAALKVSPTFPATHFSVDARFGHKNEKPHKYIK